MQPVHDFGLRPVYRVLEDGTHIRFHYAKDSTVAQSTLLPNGKETLVQRSPDGKRETWRLAGGDSYSIEYDTAGLLKRLQQSAGDPRALSRSGF